MNNRRLLERSDVVTSLRAAGCVFAEDEAQLLISAAQTPAALAAMVDHRTSGLPLAHVLGWAEFCGVRVAVDRGVFVPRPRSEFLARQAISLVRQTTGPAGHLASRPRAVVVDLCCGSGALGVAVAGAVGGVELHAVDIHPAAAACARRNVGAAGGHVYEGDLFDPLPPTLRGRVDVVVANAPYVPSGEMRLLPGEARRHEPPVALDGGEDGLRVVRRLIAAAPGWLAPGGHLLVETSERQASKVAAFLAHCGLPGRVATADEQDATVVIGTRPVPQPEARPAGNNVVGVGRR